MSNTIDERIVQMRFDNKQFERNAQTSIETLENLKKSLDLSGAAKGLENINTTSKKINFSGLSNAVENVKERFSALEVMAVTALANITNSAVNTGKRLLQSLTVAPVSQGYKEYELKMGSIQTMMMSTGESLETVNKYLDELNVYADKTIYSFSDMTSNIGKFTNAGVNLKDSVKAIQGISNVAAISGANTTEASRAMYNFAQALSAGSVKLIDWKSIENANMATVEFKNQLLSTALELGTVVKKGNRYVTTTTNINGKTSEAFDATHLFNDSLNHQWMTTEVLVKTLNKYSDETTEIGKKAFSAAQDVKTFTQLLDTLKEAVGSGWATTWEIVFGDFEQAKKLWTGVSNVVSGFIDRQSKARNELLKGWKDLGGREAVIIAVKNAFDGLKSVIVPVKEAFREFFPTIKPETLVRLSNALKDLTAKFKINKKTTENLKNSFRGFFAVMSIVKSLLGAIFRSIKPLVSIIGGQSSGLIGKTLGITSSIGLWLKNLDAVIKKHDLFYNSIQLAINYIKSGIDYIKKFADTIRSQLNLPQLSSVGKKFSDFVDDLKNKIGEFSKTALSGIDNFGQRISKALNKDIDTTEIDNVNKKLSHTEIFTKRVSTALENMKNGLISAINAIKEYVAQSRVFNFLKTLWIFISKIAIGIGKIIGSALSDITKKLEKADFDSFLSFINTLSIGGIAIAIKKFLDSISGSLSGILTQVGSFKKIISGVTGVLNGVQKCLDAYQTQLKAGVLLKIAIAIGILAASVIALSLVDSRKLQASLGAITVMFADLMASMKIFGKVNGKLDNTNKAVILMLGMSAALLILASACKKLANLNMKELGVGLAGVSVLLFELTSFTSKLNTNNKKIISCSTALIVIATAMKVLVSACKSLSVLNWDELGRGVAGLTVLMYILADFTKKLSNTKKIFAASVSLIAIGAGMKVLVSACKGLASLSWEELGKGVAGITVLMYVLADFTKKLSNNKILKASVALIAIGTSMKILVSACKGLAALNWEELGKGIAGMSILMYVLSEFTKKLSKSNKIFKASIALIAIGAAMKILVSACSALAELSIEGIIKALAGIGIILLEVSMYAKLNNNAKNIMQSSIALIAMGTAMKIFASVCRNLSSLDWDGLGKALLSIGAIFLAAGLFSKMTQKNKHMIATGVALISMAAGLKIFASVCKTIAVLSWEEIAKALITIAGAFVIIGVAGKILGPIVPSILGLAGALALFGVGFVALGAGLMLIGTGLTSISVGLASLTTSLSVGATEIVAALAIIIAGIAKMIPYIAQKIGEGIIEFCKTISEGAPELGKAIKEIVKLLVETFTDSVPKIIDATFELIQNLLDALIENAPTIVGKVMKFLTLLLEEVAKNLPSLIQAGVDVLVSFFVGIFEALNNQDSGVISKALAGVKMLAELLLALAALGALAVPAMTGVLAVGALVAELTAVFAALGLLEQIPGIDWLIGEGGQLLGSIGDAIGSFIGGLLGGAMEGIANKLPKIGKSLADFMKNAKPFINEIGRFKPSSLDGVKALAEIVVILTATDILDGLTSWFTGGSSLVSFGEELAQFGPKLSSYYNSVKDVKDNVVTASANAAMSLAELADKLPKHDGLLQWFFGQTTLTDFANELADFGPSIAKYSNDVKNVNSDAVKGSANAALSLAELAQKLPSHNGVMQWFLGDATLSSFSKELEDFGPSIAKYSESIGNVNAEAVTASAYAALSLADLANNLPEHGGVVSWFTGDATLSTFAKELEDFGPAISKYSESVSNIDEGKITTSANAASVLSQAASNLPKHNGVVQVFTGDATLSTFAKELEDFGPAIAKYSDSVKDINENKVNSSANAALILAKANDNLPESGGLKQVWTGEKSLSLFASGLKEMGPAIKDYSDSVEGINSEDITSSANAIKIIAEANHFIPESGGIKKVFTGEKSLSLFATGLKEMGPAIKDYSDSVEGINTNAVTASSNAIKIIAEANSTIPESGGIKQYWTGEQSLSAFSENLTPLAKSVKNYYTEVKDIKTDAMLKTSNFLKVIAGVYEALPNVGGIASWFSGNKASLNDFGEGLTGLAVGIQRFYAVMYGLNSDDGDFTILMNAIDATEKLAKAAITLAEFDSDTLTAFGEALAQLASNGINRFEKEFYDADKKVTQIATRFIAYFSDTLKDSTEFAGDLFLAMAVVVQYMTNTLEDEVESWKKKGKDLANALSIGITSKSNDIVSAITNIMSKTKKAVEKNNNLYTSGIELIDGLRNGIRHEENGIKRLSEIIVTVWLIPPIKNKYQEFYNLGLYLIQGFAQGLLSNTSVVSNTAAMVALAASNAMAMALKINSPSKIGYKLGGFLGMGFVKGLQDEQYGSFEAGMSIGDSAKKGLNESINRIREYIDGKIDTSLRIQPILDLSELKNGVSDMNNLINAKQSMMMADQSGISFNSSGSYIRQIKTDNSDVVDEISALRQEVSILQNSINNLRIVMDTGALVGSIAGPVNHALGRQARLERRRN